MREGPGIKTSVNQKNLSS